jgi:hypothetical protein
MSDVIEATVIEDKATVPSVSLSVMVTPGAVVENFDKFKEHALAKVEVFDDCDLSTLSVKEAKSARAWLNAQAKAINDERIKWERIYMEPFDDYKSKANELRDIFKDSAERIATRVKEAEEWYRKDKRQVLENYYRTNYGLLSDVVPFDRILKAEWLNKSNKTNPERAIDDIAKKLALDWESLKKLSLPNLEQAEVVLFRTLDLGEAISENDRIESDKARIAEIKRQAEETRQQQARDRAVEAPTGETFDPETGEVLDDIPVASQEAPVASQSVPDARETQEVPTQAPDVCACVIESICPVEVAREAARLIDARGYDVTLKKLRRTA